MKLPASESANVTVTASISMSYYSLNLFCLYWDSWCRDCLQLYLEIGRVNKMVSMEGKIDLSIDRYKIVLFLVDTQNATAFGETYLLMINNLHNFTTTPQKASLGTDLGFSGNSHQHVTPIYCLQT